MREEILAKNKLRKLIKETTEGEMKEFYYVDPDEHFQIWYWLTYIGAKDKWRPPVDWSKTRKRLVSVGHEYQEPYPYPKNSWRASTEEEVALAKKRIQKGSAQKVESKRDIKKADIDLRGREKMEPSISWVDSRIFIFEDGSIIKMWRANDEENLGE